MSVPLVWETLQKWAYLGYIECLIHHGITKSGSSAISSSPIGISCTAITLIPLPLMSLMTKLFDFIHLRWDVILDFFTCVIKRSIWWKILSMQDCYNVLIVQNCLESIEVSLPSRYTKSMPLLNRFMLSNITFVGFSFKKKHA